MEDKEKLEKILRERITDLFERVLDYTEVAVPNNEQYKKLRSKILRIGNNCIRNVLKDLKDYEVTYSELDTVVEYKQPKYDKRENDVGDTNTGVGGVDNPTRKELNIPTQWTEGKQGRG